MAFRIYTKTGDKGETSLWGGKRLPKSHIRIEAYGTVDELNVCVGLLRDHCVGEAERVLLKAIQDRLFSIGAVLAAPPEKQSPASSVGKDGVATLEKAIDAMNESLPELKHFILPGGHPAISFCHLARVVCRRAERRVVALALEEPVDEAILRYFNRLSDYLFVLARFLGAQLGVDEIKWNG